MNKLIIFAFVALILTPIVAAELTRLSVPLYVDFIDPNEFTLIWDGGTRNFDWANSTTPADTNFTMFIYRELDTAIVCSKQLDAYKNLTESMVGVMNVCKDLADANNISLAMELSNEQFSHGLQTEKLATCNNDLALANEKAVLYESCELDRNNLRTRYNNCTSAIANKAKSGPTGYIVSVLITAIICYFVWGKKKDIPSEYKEEGFESY